MGETIVLGGGCFWCTEAVFSVVQGVIKAVPGYSGGNTENPSYEEVCTGATGHAEVLMLEYDPERLPLERILEVFFEMHDPTSVDGQGADIGPQYRSIILYTSEAQRRRIEEYIEGIRHRYKKPVVTEVRRLVTFYPAEDYHKEYYLKNPTQPYCLLVIKPKVEKIMDRLGIGRR